MKEKETTPRIYQAIVDIMADIKSIGKDNVNQQQRYKFRGIDDMYNVLHPLFKKHKVFITSNVLETNREERTTTNGGRLIYTITKMEFKFMTIDGSYVSSILEGEAMDSGDKSTNKALSTALKYAVMQMFLIPTEDLKDSDSDTYDVSGKSITQPGQEEGNAAAMMQKKPYKDMSKKPEPVKLPEPKKEEPIKFTPDESKTESKQNPETQKIVNEITAITDPQELKDRFNDFLDKAKKSNLSDAEISIIRQAANIHFATIKDKK